MSALRERYRKEIRGRMMKDHGYPNDMAVPRLQKIVINMGVGEASREKKVLDTAVKELRLISGQQPIVTKARKSVAGFKIREGWPIGCKVTLRGVRMYDFLERLIDVVIPRIRDFRGFRPDSFDGRGNYSLGITEQLIFPEIDYDNLEGMRGLDITFCTSSRNDDEARNLLLEFKFPLRAN